MAAKTPVHHNPKGPLGSSKEIPIPGLENRRDGWRPAPSDISATPGGTMFAMTPGGNASLSALI